MMAVMLIDESYDGFEEDQGSKLGRARRGCQEPEVIYQCQARSVAKVKYNDWEC